MKQLRRIAALATEAAHMLVAMAAGVAAGTYAWRHGWTLPFDSTDSAVITATLAVALVSTGAVATLLEPWVRWTRRTALGHPLACCLECGGLVEVLAADTAPKEISL